MQDVFVPNVLAGQTAFITGGSSGINRHIAQRFVQAGARVAVVGRDAERARNAAQLICAAGGEAIGVAADVRDYNAMSAALAAVHARWGLIDVVIAGAAGNFVAPALGMSANGFRSVVEIDLLGTFNTVRAAHAYLRKPGSTVLAISAVQAQAPTAAQAHVCAAKAGVEMLMRTLAVEWGGDGIRCLGISPGPVAETEGMRRLAPQGQSSLQRLLRAVPAGRQASQREIADLALYLVSGAAEYINGTVIQIDGGLLTQGMHAFGEMLIDALRAHAAADSESAAGATGPAS